MSSESQALAIDGTRQKMDFISDTERKVRPQLQQLLFRQLLKYLENGSQPSEQNIVFKYHCKH